MAYILEEIKCFYGRRLQSQTGLGTTKGFEMKQKMLLDVVMSRKNRKAVSEIERSDRRAVSLLVQLFLHLLLIFSPELLFWRRNPAQKYQRIHLWYTKVCWGPREGPLLWKGMLSPVGLARGLQGEAGSWLPSQWGECWFVTSSSNIPH